MYLQLTQVLVYNIILHFVCLTNKSVNAFKSVSFTATVRIFVSLAITVLYSKKIINRETHVYGASLISKYTIWNFDPSPLFKINTSGRDSDVSAARAPISHPFRRWVFP